MKRSSKMLALLLVGILSVSASATLLTGCNNEDPKDKLYTYREYISASPSSWNSHIGTTDTDEYVQGYTEMGFYDITLNQDRTSYMFVDEMATGDPVDVTANYKGQYGIAEDAESGRAFKITLNADAKWQNGEAIKASDYVWSMQQLLDPNMKNSKSVTYTTGTAEIYNAHNYYLSSEAPSYAKIEKTETYTDDQLKQLAKDGKLFFSVDLPIGDVKGDRILREYHDTYENNYKAGNEKANAIYARYFKDKDIANGKDLFKSLVNLETNEYGFAKITEANFDSVKADLQELFGVNFGDALGAWYTHLAVSKNTNTVYTKILKDTVYTDADLDNLIAEGKLFFSIDLPINDDAVTRILSEYHDTYETAYNAGNEKAVALYSRYFTDKDIAAGTDLYAPLKGLKANAAGFVKVTEDNFATIKDNLYEIMDVNFGAALGTWYTHLAISSEEEIEIVDDFSKVGLFADGDNAIVIVFANDISLWDVKYALTNNWLVYKPLYEAGFTTIGSLKATDYGTTVDKYMAYGPYKLVSYQKDKELLFERNENWYGYDKDATNYHEGEFMTDVIKTQVISSQATALLEFEKGNLDQVKLVSTDLSKYKFSEYMLKRTASNIWQIAFNSDLNALGEIEKDGAGNRRVLSLADFRKGISLSLNRAQIGANIMVGSAPAYFYINNNFYYDMENDSNSVYRLSEQGMKAIVDLYGIEYGAGKTYETVKQAYNAVTGYDLEEAKACFTSAYNKAITDGIYTDGSAVKITIYNNAVSAALTSLGEYIQAQINEATKGTGFEGKITVEFKESASRQDDLNKGLIEASYYSRSGDYNDPYGVLGDYTNADQTTLLEYGFNPATEKFSIEYDFDKDGTAETVEKTYTDWQKSVVAGGTYANASSDIKLIILSTLENKLLGGFRTIPLCVGTDVLLHSAKVQYATDTANIFAAYGGIRLYTYNYNDGDWANYCINNTLNYAG